MPLHSCLLSFLKNSRGPVMAGQLLSTVGEKGNLHQIQGSHNSKSLRVPPYWVLDTHLSNRMTRLCLLNNRSPTSHLGVATDNLPLHHLCNVRAKCQHRDCEQKWPARLIIRESCYFWINLGSLISRSIQDLSAQYNRTP